MSTRTGSSHHRQPSANDTRRTEGLRRRRRLQLLGLGALGGLLLVLLLLALAPPANAQCVSSPRVFYVDDDYFIDNPLACQYKSITNVTVLGLQSGDIINIANGSYTLNYNLTVNGTSWIGESQASVFVNQTLSYYVSALSIRAANTRVTNITFTSMNAGIDIDFSGPSAGTHNGNTVENVTLYASGYACYCSGQNTTLTNISAKANYGFYNGAGANFTLRNIVMVHTYQYGGTLILYTPDFDIQGVVGYGAGNNYVTDIWNLGSGSIRDVWVTGYDTGFYVGSGNGAVVSIRNATIVNGSYAAVYAYNGGPYTFEDITATGLTQYGLYVDGNTHVTARNFTVSSPNYGIYVAYYQATLDVQRFTASGGVVGLLSYGAGINATDLSLTGFSTAGVQVPSYSFATRLNASGLTIANSQTAISVLAAGSALRLQDVDARNGSGNGIYLSGSTLEAANIALSNFSSHGVQVVGTSTLNLTNANLTGVLSGIFSTSSALSSTLRTFVARDGGGYGIYFSGGTLDARGLSLTNFSSDGIDVLGTSQVAVSGAVIRDTANGVLANSASARLDLSNIFTDNGTGCGLSLNNAGANVTGLTATNFSLNPICGGGSSQLNVTGLLAIGGNDNIFWPGSRPLVVRDALLGRPGNAGIYYQSSTALTLQNVTVLDAPSYGVYCRSPCASVSWTGGGVNNSTYGFYPSGAFPVAMSQLNFTNLRDTAVPMWWGVVAPTSFHNITVVNASSGIYTYNAVDMEVADCTFVSIRYSALSIYNSQHSRLYNNAWWNASDPLEWDLTWTPDSPYNFHDIPPTNTIDGKPIRYYLNATGVTVPANTSQLIVINGTNIQASGLNQTAAYYGVMVAFSRNVRVSNSTLVGYAGAAEAIYTDDFSLTDVASYGNPNGWNPGFYGDYMHNVTITNYTAVFTGTYSTGNVVNIYDSQNLSARGLFGVNVSTILGGWYNENIDARDLAGVNLSWALVEMGYPTNMSVANGTALGGGTPVNIYYGDNVDVRDIFAFNYTGNGFYAYQGNWVNVTNYTGVSQTGYGAYIYQSQNLTMRASRFGTNSTEAFRAVSTTDLRVLESTIVSLNGTTFLVSGTNVNLVVYHNNFYGGTISNSGGQGLWDLGFPQGGNYYAWAVGGFTDEFTGVLKTTPGRDGLADQNYTVGGSAIDYYPLMDPWPPGIILTSPAEGSVIQAGTPLNFTISNFFDSVVWSDAFAGNGSAMSYPHDINTTGWPDGWHNITVTATDSVAPAAVRTFSFEFDSTLPTVVTTPALGSASVAQDARINITVSDLHLTTTSFKIDGGPTITGTPTYSVDTTGWSVGNHWILITANDSAGNLFTYNWTFYIDGAAPTISLFDPTGVTFVPPGTQFTYDASDEFMLAGVTFQATPLNATSPYSGNLSANTTRFSLDTTGWDEGCYGLRVVAADDAGHTAFDQRDICVDGSHPDLSGVLPVYTGQEDAPFTFPGAAVQDLDWNPSFTWEFDPALFQSLMTLAGRSPTFTFDTPANYSVHLVVVDRAGNVATKDFIVHIEDVTPPTADFSLPATAPEDQNLTLDATGSFDNDPSWSLNDSALFQWEVTGPSGTITLNGSLVSVNLTEPGNHTVNLTVFDPTGLSATVSHTVYIQDKTAPTIAIDGLEAVINEGDWVYFDASGTTDNLPGELTFGWSFTYDGSPRTVTGDTLDFQFVVPGMYTITLSVTDGAGNLATEPLSLRVNDVPSLANTPLTQVVGGQAYSWQIEILDNDTGDSHSFDLVDGPAGLTVTNTGLVQWSPSKDDYGVHAVNIEVYDDYGYLVVNYVITVTREAVPGNHAPAFSSFPVQSATPGGTYSYAVRFADPDAGDHLTLALAAGPEGMTLDSSDTLRWDVPDWFVDGDSAEVSLALSDGLITVYQNFTIRIRLANAAAQFVAGAIPDTVEVKVGESTMIPLGPGVANDTDDAFADLSFFVVISSGNSVEASIQVVGGQRTLVITGINPGTSTLTLRVADPSGAGEERTITATVPESTVAGGDMSGLFLLLALAAVGGVAALVILKRRRPGDEGGATALEPPTAGGAEEVQVDVVEEPAPAKPSTGAAVGAAAAGAAVGAGAAAAAAARAGPAVPPVAAKPSKGATYTIEGLFIIYQDGRMIFSKTDLGAEQLGDPELVSSMFTAVTQFIKDSFSAEGDLNKMGYGDNQIFIERGNHVYIAAIAFGEPDKELQEKMGTAIEKIEYSYAGVIEAWDGQTNRFSDIEKYVAPILALTAGITRGDVLAATTTREVKVLSQLEFFQGFVRLKVGVKNDTEAVVTKVTLDIDYNEDVLRLQRIEPASYKTSGARVMLNVLNPGEKSSVAFYFDPQICTETNIDGIVRFRDYKGVLQSVTMKTRKAEVVCPLFFTKEHANTAMLKRLIETELMERDSKVYSITKLPPYVKHKDIFEICKAVVLSHDVHMVREFVTYNPFSGEAWFYGETKVKGYKIVIRTAVREDNTIEFFAASSVIKAVTGLLAEFNHTLVSMVVERYSDVKIEQIYDEGKKHEIQSKSLVDKLGEGEASAGETEQ